MENQNPIELSIGQLLIKKGLTVSVAESCTGGLISSRLTDVSGSSEYIKLNLVTYSNEAKITMLKVDPELINGHGAVSEAVALAMAEGIRKLSQTTIGVGTTGIAGPTGGTPQKPVGLVYIALASKEHAETHRINIDPSLSRTEIKRQASEQALVLLKNFITNYL